MKFENRWGYASQQLKNEIERAICAGKTSEPAVLFESQSPKEALKRIAKALNGSEDWIVNSDQQTVWYAGTTSFSGFASWGPTVEVETSWRLFRFRVLHLDHLKRRTVYLTPISTFSSLPGCDYSKEEISLARSMADLVLQRDRIHVLHWKLKHPARDSLLYHQNLWQNEGYDERELLGLLKRQPLIWEAAMTALDSQLHVLKRMHYAPQYLVNFVRARSSDLTPDQWVRDVLGAFCFSNSPGLCQNGVIEITVKAAEDIREAERYPERMVLLEAGTGTQLASVLKRIERSNSAIKAEAADTDQLLIAPIAISNSVLTSPWAVDLKLDKTMPRLSDIEKMTLRSAMAKMLNREVAEHVYDEWKTQAWRKEFFLQSGMVIWRGLLRKVLLETWFPTFQDEARAQSESEEDRRQREEQETMSAINLALGKLSDLDSLNSHIVSRPESVEQWEELQANGALAFRYDPSKGQYAGEHFIAFDRKKFDSYLLGIGCSKECFNAVITACEERGIIISKDHAITLDKTTHCVLIAANCS